MRHLSEGRYWRTLELNPREVATMTRAAIARLFFTSVSAIGVGIELFFVAGILGSVSSWSANDSLLPTPLAYSRVVSACIATALVAGGVLGQLFAWIAAVINTAKLEEKTWVLGLVVLGLLSFGFAALVAYMIGAPDESEDAHRRGALPDRRLPGLAS
jgi:hypothetical protein